MFYSHVLRPLLFQLDPERAHELTLKLLNAVYRLGLTGLFVPPAIVAPIKLMGLTFPNRVGLAAGLDKNGAYIAALAALGFGFIEIGTVTPKAQTGQAKPRLFRLPEHEAIINRMGFNNLGLNALVSQVRYSGFDGVLGINIGKNADTPIDRAIDDYLLCMDEVYALASYIVVNISSPNTPHLRTLQHKESLAFLLTGLKQRQQQLCDQHQRYVPLLIKVAPDLEETAIVEMAQLFIEHQIDGVIATNTTLRREGVASHPFGCQVGGLSGLPLKKYSSYIIRKFSLELGAHLPIIGVGGIHCAADAREKLNQGASLVQLYTGLIYQGPRLIAHVAQALTD